jgi:hypothetical protein
VAARLAALAPGGADGRATLIDEAGGVRLRLVRGDGTVVGDRRLDGGFPCDELAEAAALVLASWQSELQAAPVTAPPPATAPAAPARPAAAATTIELGAGLTAAPDLVPGATLVAAVGRGAWAAELTAGASVFRRDDVGGGQVRWLRAPLILGLRRRWPVGQAWALDATAGPAAALLLVRGEGFDRNHAATEVDLGGAGVVRAWRRWGAVGAWAGLTVVGWSAARDLTARPDESRRPLPQIEGWLAVGASWAAR